jgi:uncharacterized protein YaiI (UPF0178 family)
MKIYIDGDAFPNLLKPIITKTINKYKIQTIVISNKKINIGKSNHLSYIIVEQGGDKADDEIIELVTNKDVVITADIPLANRVIQLDALAIDHRGELYTKDNIQQYLSMRNLMEQIRDSGEQVKGPKPFGSKDVYNFSNQFHNFVVKYWGK